MNERVMQFRIGIFVLMAGLVLAMLIVWFGESPQLLRKHVYLMASFEEAPGVAVGVPVRKSGIRIGEVSEVKFDERPDQPDGVLVTLQLEQQYRLKDGSVPRIARSLIGDVSIDMTPGKGPGPLKTFGNPPATPSVAGETSPDPAKALAAASAAFEKAGNTLAAIDKAASGIAGFTGKVNDSGIIDTYKGTGQKIFTLADDLDAVIKANEADIRPAIAGLRSGAERLNALLDPQTQADAKAAVARISGAAAKLEAGLNDLAPLLKDLGAPVSAKPVTTFGNGLARLNRVLADIGLLTGQLNDGKGGLNPNGSLQRLVTSPELHDNLKRAAYSAAEVMTDARPVVASLRAFARKIENDPGALARGALAR